MKFYQVIFISLLCFTMSCVSTRNDTKEKTATLSTIDFVQIVDNNKEEAIFYYQNNWKVLRQMALEKKYIHSYKLFEMKSDDNAPFEIMLVTTYSNKVQYEKREENFAEIMKLKGALELLNDKKPNDFRKTLFRKDAVINL